MILAPITEQKELFEQQARLALERVLSSRFFQHIESYTKAQWTVFATEFFFHIQAFPDHLQMVIRRCEHKTIREALYSNLIDEVGGEQAFQCADFSGAHYNLFKPLLEELGVDMVALDHQRPASYTADFLTRLDQFYSTAPELSLVAAIAPGVEFVYEQWMGKMLATLERHFQLSDQALFHLRLHTVMDKEHNATLQQAILPCLSTPQAQQQFVDGVTFMSNLTYQFFDAAYLDLQQHEIKMVSSRSQQSSNTVALY